MQTSAAMRKMIEGWEGVRLKAYRDGNGLLTIGVGHLMKAGDPMVITQEQADAYLAEDLKTAEDAVTRLVKVPIDQNQFDSLVSLTFNIGAGNFAKSTVLRLLNAEDGLQAADAFMMWDKISGKVSSGLQARRSAERAHFLEVGA